ncbi:MAG: class flavin-dependent oxidoreductase [Solirubrobacteraceae bacterium]|nr:class flavin-dependent oxidoreductase [Solirubrobacteraceae bacterium]
MALVLSVLDQSPIPEGSTGPDALANTLDLARLADELGYARYWVAEHHGGPMLASAAPEVLIGPIASATQRIHVGSGGVMLPHYSPFKVAEAFSILAGLYPGRIDMALGRASGTDPLTTLALQRDRSRAMPDDFPQQLAELLAHLEDDLPAEHPFAHLPRSLPGRPHAPEPWLLGSSPQSAIWAAQLGLPYAFADFINPDGAAIAQSYREQFADGVREPRPHTLVAAWVICAETDDEAQRLASSSRMTLRLLRRGQLIPVPPPEKALRYLEHEGVPTTGPLAGRRGIIGSPETVRAGLEELAESYGADELMVVTITHDHGARRRSYELIADTFGLRDADQPPSRSASMPPIVPT